jgi:protein-tyrosine phosphatase
MTDSVNGNLNNIQNDFPKGHIRDEFTDIHCHCLPGLDDGPVTMSEALTLCQVLATEDITTIVATPHQLGRFEGRNEAVSVREAVHNLNKQLRNNNIQINILPGGEVRVDERLCQLMEADEILTLADGGRYLLLELPNEVFIDIESLIQELASIGIQSIISHAERITQLIHQPDILNRWFEHSASLQITASSLMGDFGLELQRNAWYLLSSGWAAFVATDSHNINSRKPRMKAAFQSIIRNLGGDTAHLVCIENPSRVLNGRDIVSVSTYHQQEANW